MTPVCLPIGRHMRLLYLQTERFKSESLSLSFATPLKKETAQKNAMLPVLACRGTATYPTHTALNLALDNLYSTSISTKNRRVGDYQVLEYRADFLGARFTGGGRGLLPEVVKILGELVLSPRFDEKGNYQVSLVKSEKQNLRDAIRAEINDTRALAHARARALLCEGEAGGLSPFGTEDTVGGMTGANLRRRFDAYLLETAPVFCYVGSTPMGEVAALLEAAFAPLTGEVPVLSHTVKAADGVKRESVTMPVCQTKLSLGFRAPVGSHHESSPALLLLNEVFGGSPASLLFTNVREKMGLCYHCSSALDRAKGLMFVNSGVSAEHKTLAEEAILTQFARLSSGDFSEGDLEAARLSLTHSLRQVYDSPTALSRFYVGRSLAGIEETTEEWGRRILAVTKSDVQEVAGAVSLGAAYAIVGTGEEADDE